MEAFGDHYATLRVRPDADAASLRRAYRDLMRRHHPDVNDSADSAERCQAINEAYACLRDPSRRAHYDARRRAHHRARRAAFSPTPPPSYAPHWPAEHKDWLDDEDDAQKRRNRAVGIGVAMVLTFATFAATSAVDTAAAPPEKPVVQTPDPDPDPADPKVFTRP